MKHLRPFSPKERPSQASPRYWKKYILEQFSYRIPMQVTAVRFYGSDENITSYPVCPRCKLTMEREYQHYCDRCGQCLDWAEFDERVLIEL